MAIRKCRCVVKWLSTIAAFYNGRSTEFISKALDLWAYENNVTLYSSRPGKPTDNPYIESGVLLKEFLLK
jgi:transposase InsO family protein